MKFCDLIDNNDDYVMRRRIQRLRFDHQYPVRLADGTILWYDELWDARDARRKIKQGQTPPKPTQLLEEFGAGIESAGDGGYKVYLCGEYLDWSPDLESAVDRWVNAENWTRTVTPVHEAQNKTDARYFDGVQFDKDGYKILNPQIRRVLNG